MIVRRIRLGTIVLLLGLVMLGAVAEPTAAANPPNILFILVDDQSPFDLKILAEQERLDDPYRLWDQQPAEK